jgi:hypothetical protein
MDPNAASIVFDNNCLLQKGDLDGTKEDALEVEREFGKKINQSKSIKKIKSTVTSLQNVHVD